MIKEASIRFNYLDDTKIVIAAITGLYEPGTSAIVLKHCISQLRLHSSTKMLVDFRNGRYLANTIEIHSSPQIATQINLPRKVRYAFVHTELTSDTYFFETVFINQGYQLQVFDDYNQATMWLID